MRYWVLAALLLAATGSIGWLIWSSSRPLIVGGYTDLTSYSPGDTVQVYLDARRSEETFVRLYDAAGRVVDSVRADVFPQHITNPEPWRNGFGFRPTFAYPLPPLKSGVYFWERVAPFVVRSQSTAPDLVVVYPANTIAAYNRDGGRGLYGPSRGHRLGLLFEHLISRQWDHLIPGHAEHRATAVSFQRTGNMTDFNLIQPFLIWADSLSYDIAYVSDPDLDDYERIAGARLLVIIGHNEYWTRQARRNFDRFVDSGKPALILSGNTMWWQVRYDSTRTRVICYKDGALDPVADRRLATITWDEEELAYPIWKSIGAQFPLGGYGLREDRGWNGFKIVAAASPLLEGVTLPEDSILSVPTLEYDGTWLLPGRNHPVLDTTKLGFYRAELIGYDYGQRPSRETAPAHLAMDFEDDAEQHLLNETVGTFIVFQKSDSSGTVVNVGSMHWCSTAGMGGRDGTALKRITYNAIQKLLDSEPVFSRQ